MKTDKEQAIDAAEVYLKKIEELFPEKPTGLEQQAIHIALVASEIRWRTRFSSRFGFIQWLKRFVS